MISRQNHRRNCLKLNDYTFERVRTFRFLGADINENANNHEELIKQSTNSKSTINSEGETPQFESVLTGNVNQSPECTINSEGETPQFGSVLTGNVNQPSDYIHYSEGEVEQPNTQTPELINGCMFISIMTIEIDPMELISHKKPHLRNKSYTCNICRITFNSKSDLISHIMKYLQKIHICIMCNKPFTQANAIKCQIKTDIEKRCKVCKKSLTQLISLKQHKLIHTGEKPYKCNECRKSFRDKSGFTKHLKTHTGEKPFKCNVCAISFSQSSSLKVHKLIHTDEKPHKCNECKKSFRLKSHLTSYIWIRDSEKYFKCNFCEKSFCHLNSLKRHKLNHTGEKPFKCNVFVKSFT
ncbi:Zinc finger C2H2-type [Cinara cedri]|uniref:Zinc finger C2H2-type n=1 Tax=Cinara cedri TaxID=506608 RepID=A0A5E4MQ71_9HEMI|nr:Zinc finger C2H2-type [Cinara cedri]